MGWLTSHSFHFKLMRPELIPSSVAERTVTDIICDCTMFKIECWSMVEYIPSQSCTRFHWVEWSIWGKFACWRKRTQMTANEIQILHLLDHSPMLYHYTIIPSLCVGHKAQKWTLPFLTDCHNWSLLAHCSKAVGSRTWPAHTYQNRMPKAYTSTLLS